MISGRLLACLFASFTLLVGTEALSLDHQAAPAFATPMMLRANVGSAQRVQKSRRVPAAAQVPMMQLKSTGGSAVLEKKKTIETAPQQNQEQTPDKSYHVLLFNDVSVPPCICSV